MRSIILSLMFLLAASPVLASHDKTDVITINDGSSYVGEIKNVQNAVLSLKTNAAGLLSIEWRYVVGLKSKYQYRIELTGGALRYGSLAVAEKPGQMRIVSAVDSVDVELVDIVEIVPMETALTARLDGSVNFGLTYTKANESIQYNLSADASYRSRKFIASFTARSILSTQEGGDTTNQHSATLILSQVMKARWGAFEVGMLQSNPDQGFDLRTILGGGATHFFKANSRVLFNANLGLVYNHEIVTGGGGIDNSAEVLVSIGYQQFKHSSHSPTFSLLLNTFSDLGSTRRYRLNFTSDISWKIVGNLKFSIQFTDNYDSDPPGVDSTNNDFSFVTSVGVTF